MEKILLSYVNRVTEEVGGREKKPSKVVNLKITLMKS